ncbi:MAG: GNAT family N-acetyltransferase [Pseudomonadota bacterium]|nr:GNAT family N-acetyltransferase [Pseudomonadota bacterium]
MEKINLRSPLTNSEWKKYFLFRWRILREPIGLDKKSTKDNLEEKSYHLMAIDINKIILGVGRIHFLNKEESQIRYMAVQEEYRKMGIGKRIVIGLEGFSKKNHRYKIILNARDNAVNFYSKLGYKILGPYDAGIGIDHYKMSKNLEIVFPSSDSP